MLRTSIAGSWGRRPDQSVWDLCGTKWHWYRCLCLHFSCPLLYHTHYCAYRHVICSQHLTVKLSKTLQNSASISEDSSRRCTPHLFVPPSRTCIINQSGQSFWMWRNGLLSQVFGKTRRTIEVDAWNKNSPFIRLFVQIPVCPSPALHDTVITFQNTG
jgi:hypothetical protein